MLRCSIAFRLFLLRCSIAIFSLIGAQISEDLEGTIRVLLIVTGVNSPQIFGPKRKMSQKETEEIGGN